MIRLRTARPALVIAGALAASLAFVTGGVAGLLYLVIYALVTVPGLPLGFRLFGRNPGGLIAGALIGYVLTAFAIWAVIAAGAASAWAFAGAWAVLTAATWWGLDRRSEPLVATPVWSSGALSGLTAVIVLTLALAAPPFARIGEADAAGNRYYRAYFTADFVWHTALAAELGKFSMPPRNPYLASEPIHYYWTYFLVPAAVAQTGPAPLRDVQRCLASNAIISDVLLMSSVFLLAWTAVGRAAPVTVAVILALLAGSFEGTYEVWRLWMRGQGFAALRDTNIDAITAWHWQGHRIDGLPRCLWYVPQHSMAYSLGLVALTVATAAGSAGSLLSIVLAGVALACAAAINPFVGGVFALAWGFGIAVDALRRPAFVTNVSRHLAAAIPVAAAIGWCVASRMVEGAGGVLEIGFSGASRHAPLWSLFISLGPVLILVAAGLAWGRSVPLVRISTAVALAALSLLLMFLVRLRVDQEWVPFRAGQMFLVAAPAIAARWLAAMWNGMWTRRLAGVAAALLLVLGLPTTAIDAFNAQDIENPDEGAGFHWTVVLSTEQLHALNWIKRATPQSAIVQMEPEVRGRESWSLIPSFGERRMAAGQPISLMQVPEYQERSDRVKAMYETGDVYEAWAIAHELRIDYVYVDALDRSRYTGVAKFDGAQDYFRVAFKRGPVAVYEVR